ncbi:DUF4148 domain-containing protein [Burkholderia gladioli]|uniref:DUF4148 domain-containing protein n=1 Tax=Burkholderia gladioli TaxID=28095 RepID=UPI0016421091|nr:DUF4148 domain-containing protein [Burkholderia gladioli]
MKLRLITLLIAAALATPLAAQAQSTVTRAQVRHELVELESVGYRPTRNDIHYPDSIQAAEAKLASNQTRAGIGYQPAARTEASSLRTATTSLGEPLYAHH